MHLIIKETKRTAEALLYIRTNTFYAFTLRNSVTSHLSLIDRKRARGLGEILLSNW